MESPTPITPKKFFNMLGILHAAMMLGQVVLGVFAVLLVMDSGVAPEGQILRPFLIVGASGGAVLGIAASFFIFQKKLETARLLQGLRPKLDAYRTAFILKLALMEGPSLFAIVCHVITGDQLFIVLSGLVLLVFAVQRPISQKVMDELDLSTQERAALAPGAGPIR